MALPPVAARSSWPLNADDLMTALRAMGWSMVELMEAPSDEEGDTITACTEVLGVPYGLVGQTDLSYEVCSLVVTSGEGSRVFIVDPSEGVPAPSWVHVHFERRARLDLDVVPWWYA